MVFPLLAFQSEQSYVVLTGLFGHLCFNHLEPHNPIVWLILLFGLPVFPFFMNVGNGISITGVIVTALLHICVLLFSVALYRISPFHPLSRFPGPFMARITALYMTKMAISGKRHRIIAELHQKYGSHVRIGPNAVSVVHVDAIKNCLATQGMPRAAYNYMSEAQPLHVVASASIRVPQHDEVHLKKRKLWSQAFTGSAINDYDEYIKDRATLLVQRLEEQIEPVDIAKWVSYFTFDLMGDIVFGGGFEMLRDGGDAKGLWSILLSAVHSVSITATLDWTGNILSYIPNGHDFKRLSKFADERIIARKKMGSTSKDLFYYMTENENDKNGNLIVTSQKELADEMFLSIIAGADTTSSVLANIFYSLLTVPNSLKKLQDEIDGEFGNEDSFNGAKLAKLPYLNAVIHEGLRLYPAVPFQLGRTPETGTGGKIVAGEFIPEGTTIYLPIYAYHRDPRYFFPSPDSFCPERWINIGIRDSTQIIDMGAFNPFSYGPANCVGKHLAYKEMRVVIARLVQKFEMQFMHGYNSEDWLEELKDDGVFVKGRLPVRLTARK